MVKKSYDWEGGAELGDHSKIKHQILRDYFRRYLLIRCCIPQQKKFRVVVVDGFSGAGRYGCGSPGSPIIFIEELRYAFDEINIMRANQGFPLIRIECVFVFNDSSRDAVNILKEQCAPLIAEIKYTRENLCIDVEYMVGEFSDNYGDIKSIVLNSGCKNSFFNLDQYGYAGISKDNINDIMCSTHSAEIVFTFSIGSFISYLPKRDRNILLQRLAPLGILVSDVDSLDEVLNRTEWLGEAERIVFDSFKGWADFVSPFSINSEDGWRYWLIHFARSYRARQEYNDILHKNSNFQAHFGRSGLNMLAYKKGADDGMLYTFNEEGRLRSREQLVYDIPKMIMDLNVTPKVEELLHNIYNDTPAHSAEINSALVNNQDLIILTEKGGARRSPNRININDVVTLKRQKSFYFMYKIKM